MDLNLLIACVATWSAVGFLVDLCGAILKIRLSRRIGFVVAILSGPVVWAFYGYFWWDEFSRSGFASLSEKSEAESE